MPNQKSLNNNAGRCSSYKTKIIKFSFMVLFPASWCVLKNNNSIEIPRQLAARSFINLVALLCYKSEFCIFTKEIYNKSEKKLNFCYHRGQVIVLERYNISTRLKVLIWDIFRWKSYSFGMNTHVSIKSLANIKSKLYRFFEFNKVDNNKLQKES